ncbi:MAG: lytic transglycosylase domain-containing protein [Pseudolabrys sp.]|nr:lytic transglycosylase domain-containing protein [Pseudolabrys sp.]MBV9955796.1 lytic transglycosylase domain-containing protein [Pseudolabrys sp.]
MTRVTAFIIFAACCIAAPASAGKFATDSNGNLDSLISQHASANGVPESLVRRVILRESRGNARAVSKGNYGLMQIRLGTARGMGYRGDAAGLLDPHTNMTYAVKYLAGAYKVAGGNESRAVSLYASGYYYVAKNKGMLGRLADAGDAFAQAETAPGTTAVKPSTPADAAIDARPGNAPAM